MIFQPSSNISGAPYPTGQGISPNLSVMQDTTVAVGDEDTKLKGMTGIQAFLDMKWQEAQNAKTNIEEQIIDAYLARRGEYRWSEYFRLSKGNRSVIYMNVTKAQCKSMESWLEEIFFPAKGHAWEVRPTPKPSLSEEQQMSVIGEVVKEFQELAQAGFTVSAQALQSRAGELNDFVKQEEREEAGKRAEAMQNLMRDQLAEGNWEEALKDFIKYFVACPAGMLRGPLVRMRKRLGWDGERVIEVVSPVIEWEALNPLDVYPMPRAKGEGDGYFIRHRYTMKDLMALKSLPGASVKAIDYVIEKYGDMGYSTHDTADEFKDMIEGRQNTKSMSGQNCIETLEYAGDVPGSLLIDLGFGRKAVDSKAVYAMNLYVVDNLVLLAQLNEGECRPKIFRSSFDAVPDAWWGEGVPDVISDVQQMANGAAREIANNMAIASGPQIIINDSDRVEDENVEEIYPFKIWVFRSDINSMTYRKPLEFFQPDSNIEPLLSVYSYFKSQADDIIGVPSPPYSNLSGAAKGTASGLSIAVGQGNKKLRSIALKVAHDIIKPALTSLYQWNMKYSQDDSVKGDLTCIVRGFESELVKHETMMRAVEFAGLTTAPVEEMILGLGGKAKLLKEIANKMGLDSLADEFPEEEDRLLKRVLGNVKSMQAVMAGGMAPGDGMQQGTQAQLDASGAPQGGQDVNIYRGSGAKSRNLSRAGL